MQASHIQAGDGIFYGGIFAYLLLYLPGLWAGLRMGLQKVWIGLMAIHLPENREEKEGKRTAEVYFTRIL